MPVPILNDDNRTLNQNYRSQIWPHSHLDDHYHKNQMATCVLEMEKREPLYSVLGI